MGNAICRSDGGSGSFCQCQAVINFVLIVQWRPVSPASRNATGDIVGHKTGKAFATIANTSLCATQHGEGCGPIGVDTDGQIIVACVKFASQLEGITPVLGLE